jgi:hypothetical protein
MEDAKTELIHQACAAASFCYKYATLVAGRPHLGNADVVAQLRAHPPRHRLVQMWGRKYQQPLSKPLLRSWLDTPGVVQHRYRDITQALHDTIQDQD